jgi:phospholipid-transporting ATPase
MEFKKFSAGPISYGRMDADNRKIENVNFEDPLVEKNFKDLNSVEGMYLDKVMTHLALCHSIILDERTKKYNSSSPDELALVNAAKFFGAEFLKRDEDNNMMLNYRKT